MKYKERITSDIKKDRIRGTKREIQAKNNGFHAEAKNAV
jgi:hypothetical protein